MTRDEVSKRGKGGAGVPRDRLFSQSFKKLLFLLVRRRSNENSIFHTLTIFVLK